MAASLRGISTGRLESKSQFIEGTWNPNIESCRLGWIYANPLGWSDPLYQQKVSIGRTFANSTGSIECVQRVEVVGCLHVFERDRDDRAAVTMGATSAQLAKAIFPHRTLSEALHEAVMATREGGIQA